MLQNLLKTGTRVCAIAATSIGLSLAATAPAKAQDFYLGTIQAFGFNFCPRGWSSAAGQLLPISQFTALFSLLGTQYGGDGRTTFGLPNLVGRSVIGFGNSTVGLGNYPMGSHGGSMNFTLTEAQMPSHNHRMNVTSGIANQEGPANDILGASSTNTTNKDIYTYSNLASNSQMRADAISSTGGGQAVSKRSPYQVANYCIMIEGGLYPPRN